MRGTIVKNTRIFSCVCTLLACSAGSAFGATEPDGLAEVVITAERRESSVQDTAASISVRTGEELQNSGRYSLKDILQDVPGVVGGLSVNTVGGQSDIGGGGITIRGLSANTISRGTTVSGVPASAIYVDNVYEGIGGSFDIGRVEVLRGPQGTLYGRSATAGVVAIHTNDPELGKVGADITLESGNYSLRHATGALNVPLGDKAALRVAGNYYERDGYISSAGGALSNAGARAKLLFEPSDNLAILLGVQFENNKNHTGGVQMKATSRTDPNLFAPTEVLIGSGKTEKRQYWAEVKYDFGGVELTWLPSYRTFTQDAVHITPGPLPGGLSQPDRTPKDYFHTQELRLSSRQGSRISWQTGVFYYDNDLEAATSLKFNSNNAPSFERSDARHTKNVGIFGEFTLPFADDWRFTGGLRHDHTYVQNNEIFSRNTNGSPFPVNPPIFSTLNLSGDAATRRFDNVTYKARLEHDLTPDKMLYALVASAVLPGDVRVATGTSGQPEIMEFKAETVTSFEIGTKNQFMDRRLQLNAAVYYYRFSGFQTNGVNVSGNDQIQRFRTVTVPARMVGGEIELLYQPTRNDRLQFDYAHTNAYFVDKPADFVNFARTDNDKFNKVIPHTLHASYMHTFEFGGGPELSVRGDGRYLSSHSEAAQFLTPSLANTGAWPYVMVDGETVADLSATLTLANKRYSVTGYVRNAFDNRYKTDVLVQTITPTLDVSTTPYDPRTWGLVVSARF